MEPPARGGVRLGSSSPGFSLSLPPASPRSSPPRTPPELFPSAPPPGGAGSGLGGPGGGGKPLTKRAVARGGAPSEGFSRGGRGGPVSARLRERRRGRGPVPPPFDFNPSQKGGREGRDISRGGGALRHVRGLESSSELFARLRELRELGSSSLHELASQIATLVAVTITAFTCHT